MTPASNETDAGTDAALTRIAAYAKVSGASLVQRLAEAGEVEAEARDDIAIAGSGLLASDRMDDGARNTFSQRSA